MNNHNIRIEYDSENMWFDYQALFDKTRNRILGLNDDIKVRHTDFKENQLARLNLFREDSEHFDIINEQLIRLINGDILSYVVLISNFHRAFAFRYDKKSLVTIIQKNLPEIYENYFYFIGIVSSLGNRIIFDDQYLMNYFELYDYKIQSIRTAISQNEIINILKS